MPKKIINNIKDKIFSLQIKSIGETLLGIATAPVLAYGVSNTLAMCFPEAAGWIRISGLRFSPVFLTLATFMIIYSSRKSSGSIIMGIGHIGIHLNHRKEAEVEN